MFVARASFETLFLKEQLKKILLKIKNKQQLNALKNIEKN